MNKPKFFLLSVLLFGFCLLLGASAFALPSKGVGEFSSSKQNAMLRQDNLEMAFMDIGGDLTDLPSFQMIPKGKLLYCYTCCGYQYRDCGATCRQCNCCPNDLCGNSYHECKHHYCDKDIPVACPLAAAY